MAKLKIGMNSSDKTPKRVGILTFHYSNHNYGALLQTYASVVILRSIGAEPLVINYDPMGIASKKRIPLHSRLFSFLRGNPFTDFRRKHLPLFPKERIGDDRLKEISRKIDCLYVGSDQVWRSWDDNFTKRLYNYFGAFADESLQRISYAPSFGKDTLNVSSEELEKIKTLIQKFSAVSVRETSGVTLCKEILEVEATQVLDPTLLLQAEDYLPILSPHDADIYPSSPYLAFYMLGSVDNTPPIVADFSKSIQLLAQNIYGETGSFLGKKYKRFRSFSQWLSGIKNAQIVVTNSFHCVVFSVIYRKPFICVPNEYGGVARMQSLLHLLGLDNRYCSTLQEMKLQAEIPIDYAAVYGLLDKEREASIRFLRQALYPESNP